MFTRILLLLTLVFSLLSAVLWLVVPVALYYSWRYEGYELIWVATLIDGYYGAFYEVPWLTIGAFFVWCLGVGLRRVLLLYTENNGAFS